MKRPFVAVLPVCLFLILTVFVIVHSRHESSSRLSGEEREGRTGAREALDFWTRARAYPEKDIPADKYYRAYQYAKRNVKRLPQPLSAANWEPIGPVNLQGRALSVAVNPQNSNTILLGTASGGLWRSYTAGLGGDWQQVRLGYPALGVSSIVYDPLDSNTIYIGTGEVYGVQRALGGVVVRTTRGSYGIGILKTTDGGATWTKSLDWTYQQQRGVQKLAMNPLNHNTIYASTSAGVYKTMDAGATWFAIDPYVQFFISHDIIIHATDTNKIMVTYGNFIHPPTLVDRSTDGGANWTNLSGLPFRSGKGMLGMSQSNPNVVYASLPDSIPTDPGAQASIWKTTDFGDSWSEISTGTNIWGVQGWYSHYVAVSPTDPNLIIFNAVGSYRSTDGGSLFDYSLGNYSDNHGYAIDPNNPSIFYTANDDGIYRSTDFGSSYTSVGFGLQTGQLYNGLSNSTTDSLLSIVQSQDHIPGYIWHGAITWGISASDEAGWTAIDPTDDNRMYAISRWGGSLGRSTDRGSTFSYPWGFGSVGSWNSPLLIAPSSPSILYAGDTRVHRSTNYGTNWTITNGGSSIDGGNTALSMAISSTSPDTVYVGMAPLVTDAHIYRTTNGGGSWTNVTGTLPNRYPMDLAVDPSNSSTVYAAFGGFGTGHFYKSTDAGTSWNDLTGSLPDAPTTAVEVDPMNPNVVYVGNDIGVYVSTNGGTSWSNFSDGLPDAVIVSDLKFSPSDRTIRLGTHGNGAYRRKGIGELPPLYVDYAPHALVWPTPGSVLIIDSTVSPIRASFRTLSEQAQPDFINAKYRILLGGDEVFAATKQIPPIAIGETRQVSFADSYTFTTEGSYTLEAIVLTTDQDSENDTLRGELIIALPPSITSYSVEQPGCPYTEIVGGSPGPSGDDAQTTAAIPFSFTYDGYPYDQVQISTNGWLELGAGVPGSFHGLSTPGQTGGFFRYALGTRDRPTKVLAPWWCDLATTSTSPASAITYDVQGNSPNRIFIVQWKDILAYYDQSQTTMRLNFQVQLYEHTNIFEFHYGSIVPGPVNAFTGANMGYKDAVGGDYRYFDLSRLASGTAADISYLEPDFNWPGENHCFRMTPTETGMWIAYDAGWNLISMPLVPADRRAQSLFPNLPVFEFTENYRSFPPTDSLRSGGGYWVKIAHATAHQYAGSDLPSVTIPVRAGWNIVGSVDHDVPAPVDPNLSAFFSYSSSGGYAFALTLHPGRGFWVRAVADGSYGLGPVGQSNRAKQGKQEIEELAGCSQITITDRLGRRQSLYTTDDQTIVQDRYLLPPLPPEGSFDARFASGRMLERVLSSGSADEIRYPILMQSPVYPLTVSYSVRSNARYELMVEEKGAGSHSLNGEGQFSIARGDERTLSLRAVVIRAIIPNQFSLEQNYPNPFNPSTIIHYSLPAPGFVSLKVYNTLGQLVATLVEEEKQPGTFSTTWDAVGIPSGIYFCRFDAGTFTQSRKMLLVR